MHYLALVLLILSLLLGSSFTSPLEAFDLSAVSAILLDYHSGQILYSHMAHVRRPPASTTKVMTAILALELGHLSDTVIVSRRAAMTTGSSIYLEEEEELTLEELIWGLLLNSGNDAAVAIAEHIGGSVESFVELMNRKAFSLGAMNTTFKNPHGLPKEGHLTTAYDLAIMTHYALKNVLFSHMVSTEVYHIPWPGHTWDRYLRNSNRLLATYPLADGVKTGWTKGAGRCLISSASKDHRRLISVVLNSPMMYEDSTTLLEYGFREYETLELVKTGEVFTGLKTPCGDYRVTLYTGRNFYYTFPISNTYTVSRSIYWREELLYPLVLSQPVAWLTLSIDGEVKGRIPLLLGEMKETPSLWRRIWEKFLEIVSLS